MNDFAHLHTHSQGSILDGFGTPEEIILRAKELGHENIALTDHGSMSQIWGFYNHAVKNGINPLIGMETYVADDMFARDKDAPIYHMGIIAKNNKGFKKLLRISYWSWNKGFYKKPRFDVPTYSKFYGERDDDLIVLSGCMNGPVARTFLSGDVIGAEKETEKLAQAFRHFYIELQPWNPPELNKFLEELADKKGIPLVVTADSHYSRPEEKVFAEIGLLLGQLPSMKKADKDLALSRTGLSINKGNMMEALNHLWPNRKLRFDMFDNYILSKSELEKLMIERGISRQDIYDNTVTLAETVSVEIKSKNYFPRFDKNLDSNSYLKDLALDNLSSMDLGENQIYRDRLLDELKIVEKLNFSDYFLVVWDVVHFAKSMNIMVGPGRGSVGGSLLAYVLGITRVDPIKYDLLFFRFLNIDIEYRPEELIEV